MKDAIAAELGIEDGSLMEFAADAVDILGINPTGKKVPQVLDECYRVIFG